MARRQNRQAIHTSGRGPLFVSRGESGVKLKFRGEKIITRSSVSPNARSGTP